MGSKVDTPLVSIITPVYNGEDFIERCYESICHQEYDNLEWIIVDDGSTDRTVALVERLEALKHVSMKFVKQENMGACSARKKALQYINGSFVINLDCDDYLSSDAISLAIDSILVSADYDISLLDLVRVDPEGLNKELYCLSVDSWPITGEKAFSQTLSGWGIHGLFLVKKEVYFEAYRLLGQESRNNINTDEFLTRLIFHSAVLVTKSEGRYFYVRNGLSTTKLFRKEAYLMMENAMRLHYFTSEHYPYLKNLSREHVVSTAWTLSKQLLNNREKLNLGEVKLWIDSIDQKLREAGGALILLRKRRVKAILKLIFVKAILIFVGSK